MQHAMRVISEIFSLQQCTNNHTLQRLQRCMMMTDDQFHHVANVLTCLLGLMTTLVYDCSLKQVVIFLLI